MKVKTVGQVVRVRLDPKTFPGWCAVRGLNLDADARTRFAVEGAARMTGAKVWRALWADINATVCVVAAGRAQP